MSWFGKFLGGTVGLIFGGPIGAIGGAALGHYLVDENEEASLSRKEGKSLDQTEQQQAIFFITTFSLLAKLAKADGLISHEEIKVIDQLMNHHLRLDSKARKYAIQVFNLAKESKYSFEDYSTQFYQTFSQQRPILNSMIDLLLRVAAADGTYHPSEERLILNAVQTFGLSQAEYESLKKRHIRNTDKYYALLNSKPHDTDSAIKKNYRKLVHEYHPDKIISKGLPPEFEDFAKTKFQEIQNAYEAIAGERGLR